VAPAGPAAIVAKLGEGVLGDHYSRGLQDVALHKPGRGRRRRSCARRRDVSLAGTDWLMSASLSCHVMSASGSPTPGDLGVLGL